MSRGEVAEEEITRTLADRLEERGWELSSVHYPGTQGGPRFRRVVPGQRAPDAIVPDIVALRGTDLLVVESKPAYSVADVRKLARLASDAYHDDIRRAARVERVEEANLVTGVAFAGECPEPPPAGLVLFLYEHRGIEVRGDVALPP